MSEYLNVFKEKKNLANLLTLLILVLALPLGISLARQQQILSSRASTENIDILQQGCVEMKDGKLVSTCNSVDLKLSYDYTGTPGPTPTVTPSPLP